MSGREQTCGPRSLAAPECEGLSGGSSFTSCPRVGGSPEGPWEMAAFTLHGLSQGVTHTDLRKLLKYPSPSFEPTPTHRSMAASVCGRTGEDSSASSLSRRQRFVNTPAAPLTECSESSVVLTHLDICKKIMNKYSNISQFSSHHTPSLSHTVHTHSHTHTTHSHPDTH